MTTSETANIATEGDPAFPVSDAGTDNPSDSQSENTNVDQTQAQEGEQDPAETNEDGNEGKKDSKNKDDRGFADDPRWIEREGDWKDRFNKQETRHGEEIKGLTEQITELGEKVAGKQDNASNEQIPDWFAGDQQQWGSFQKYLGGLTGKAKEDAIKEIKGDEAEKQKQIDDATEYMNDQMNLIESSKELQGKKLDRNKLLKFVADNDLVDSKGRWNYKAGYQMMRGIATSVTDTNLKAKKDLASLTTSESKAEDKTSDVRTSKDFANPSNRPW